MNDMKWVIDGIIRIGVSGEMGVLVRYLCVSVLVKIKATDAWHAC